MLYKYIETVGPIVGPLCQGAAFLFASSCSRHSPENLNSPNCQLVCLNLWGLWAFVLRRYPQGQTGRVFQLWVESGSGTKKIFWVGYRVFVANTKSIGYYRVLKFWSGIPLFPTYTYLSGRVDYRVAVWHWLPIIRRWQNKGWFRRTFVCWCRH